MLDIKKSELYQEVRRLEDLIEFLGGKRCLYCGKMYDMGELAKDGDDGHICTYCEENIKASYSMREAASSALQEKEKINLR